MHGNHRKHPTQWYSLCLGHIMYFHLCHRRKMLLYAFSVTVFGHEQHTLDAPELRSYTPSGVTLFGTVVPDASRPEGGFLYALWRDLVWDRIAAAKGIPVLVSIRLVA